MIQKSFAGLSSWPAALSLDTAGLVALADLSTVAQRTAMVGTSDILDSLVLCPGLHRQQAATSLHNGEIPPMAAMLTGYICRVENPAMTSYLQRVGRTGQLTVVKVEKHQRTGKVEARQIQRLLNAMISCPSTGSTAAYLFIVAITSGVYVFLAVTADWWGLACTSALILARVCNIWVIRRRNELRWHGAEEPGMQGDNLVLLTEDRWIRLKGDLDDLKAVTSGQWLREPTFLERTTTAFATVLVYMTAALASNITQFGKLVLLVLLLISVGLLSIANELTDTFSMHGRKVFVQGERIPYERRLHMISTLITEVGRSDWALRMGLIVTPDNCSCSSIPTPPIANPKTEQSLIVSINTVAASEHSSKSV